MMVVLLNIPGMSKHVVSVKSLSLLHHSSELVFYGVLLLTNLGILVLFLRYVILSIICIAYYVVNYVI